MQMDEVYRKYSLMVYKYILSLSHDENTAEEITGFRRIRPGTGAFTGNQGKSPKHPPSASGRRGL